MKAQQIGGDNSDAQSIRSEDAKNSDIKDDENSIVVTEKEFDQSPPKEQEEEQSLLNTKKQEQPKSIITELALGNKALKKSYSKELVNFEEEEYECFVPIKGQNILESEKKIQEAYNEMEEEKINNYNQAFQENIKDKELLIGSIGVESLNYEEQIIQQKNQSKLLEDQKNYHKEQVGITSSINEGRMSLYDREVKEINQIEQKEKEKIKHISQERQQVTYMFKSTVSKLKQKLTQSKKEITEDFGDLDINSSKQRYESKGQKTSMNEISTDDLPQPLLIRLQLLRAIRDKIPNGRYAMLVTIIDRIGGEALPNLNKRKNNRWKRITKPRRHNGVYYQNELRFEDTLKLDAPCKNEIKSSMAFLFELFWLKSKESSLDQVLGWGLFPLVGINYEINEGKFKIPFLFGEENKMLDKYRLIEHTMTQNLDRWLCNMYFQIATIGNSQEKMSITLDLDVF